MDVRAVAKTVRVTPRRARIVLDEIRGLEVDHAAAVLKYTPNAAAKEIAKVLNSAVANATNNHQLDEENLYIKECYADEGVIMKRFRPRAQGSASPINKRTSHITVVVSERV